MISGLLPINKNSIMQVRQSYISSIRKHSAGASFFTDKMPHNFRFIPYILSAFPEAIVLNVTRDPGAVCWSNYTQHFTSKGLHYSYNLNDLTQYYTMYHKMMEVWLRKYTSQVTQVPYESLTENTEASVSEILRKIGVPWEATCLSPEKNTRGISTASQLQIRKKIYTNSSLNWHSYKPFLAGAFDSLYEL